VVVLGAGGATAGGVISAGAGVSARSTTATRGDTRISSRDSAAAEARLAARGVRVTARATDDASDCVAHSYGQVQDFFRRHPCSALVRAQLELQDRRGDVVLVPIAWVEMPTADEAGALKTLLDGSGTGNITELSREQGRYRSVRYTGSAYASRLDGRIVVNAQAEPVARGWTGLALSTVVSNAIN
jgi:hypothetical protein